VRAEVLKAASIKIVVFRDVTLCVENEDSIFLQNIGTHLQIDADHIPQECNLYV
jgi:hypothetical protein